MKAVEFSVNQGTCIRCGLCVKDCLEGIIEMQDFPLIEPENRDKCIHCGHCQAICPTASITLDGHDPKLLEPLPKAPDRKIVSDLIKRRRSLREYKPEPVEENLLEEIIDIASYAPTSSNSRQVSWLVINGRENVEKLSQATVDAMRKHNFLPQILRSIVPGRDRIFRGAPCVLAVHAPEAIPLSSADCSTVLATLELALPSFGLASCWAGIFTVVCGKEVPQGLHIPAGNRIYGALMVGKPAVSYKWIPFRSKPQIEWINS